MTTLEERVAYLEGRIAARDRLRERRHSRHLASHDHRSEMRNFGVEAEPQSYESERRLDNKFTILIALESATLTVAILLWLLTYFR